MSGCVPGSMLRAFALLMLLPAGAGAKDLPRGAAAPRAVTPCASFGPGYVQAAGSDTCFRISGSVSVESTLVSSSSRGVGAFLSAPRH